MTHIDHDHDGDADSDWLPPLLRADAAMPADDGFSARVMRRIEALPRVAPAAAAAHCVAPAEALALERQLHERERRRGAWNAAGAIAAGVMGALTVAAQPGPVAAIAVALALLGVPWLLLRDPRF